MSVSIVGRAKPLLAALLLSLLLAAGCGGDGRQGSSGSGGSGAETTAAREAPIGSGVAASELPVLTIETSGGEEVEVRVEVADTDEERSRGLMGRTALAENRGMLFVFDEEQSLSFWMKDTLIPLSIAYIDSEGRIVDIQDMEPLDETSHPSAEPAQYALEVNQGFFDEHGVEVGDEVELPE